MHRRHREQQGLNAVHPPNIARTRTVRPIDGIPATKIRPLTHGLIKPAGELEFIKAIGPFQDRIKVIHPQFSGRIPRKLQSGKLAALLRPPVLDTVEIHLLSAVDEIAVRIVAEPAAADCGVSSEAVGAVKLVLRGKARPAKAVIGLCLVEDLACGVASVGPVHRVAARARQAQVR